jgi:hypothetical protein
VKDRLRDESPIVEEDVELLESLYPPFADVNVALDSFHVEMPSDDLSPSMKAASEAIKAAARAVKRGGPKQLGSASRRR